MPANESTWDDLAAVVAPARCHGGPCFCQRFKVSPKQWRSVGADQRAERLRAQTRCDQPGAGSTCGLVAYDDDTAVAWCRVEPRSAHAWMGKTPWSGRDEDPADETVWALTCLLVRPTHRRTGSPGP